MFEGNWKSWALMAFLVGGVTLEILKNLPAEDNVSWKAENLHLAETQPYSVHDELEQKPPRPETHIDKRPGGDVQVLQKELKGFLAANTPTATDSNKKDDGKAAAAKKKKKNDDEYEEVIDPVTGQKVRRKKKKKDDAQTATAAAPTPEIPALNPLLDPNVDTPAAVAAAAAAPAGTPLPDVPSSPLENNNNNGINTLQEWERLLLSTPDRTETLLFIKDYQSNLVTSDVFYTVVKMMIADSRADMKQLGLLCAGSTPSAASFTILADCDENQSTLKSTADTYLAKYASLGDLSYLQTVLGQTDTYAATLAAQEVDTAAKTLLGTNAATGSPSAQAGSSAQKFQVFVPILQKLASSGNSTLSAQAQQTLSDLLADGIGTNSVASTQAP